MKNASTIGNSAVEKMSGAPLNPGAIFGRKSRIAKPRGALRKMRLQKGYNACLYLQSPFYLQVSGTHFAKRIDEWRETCYDRKGVWKIP